MKPAFLFIVKVLDMTLLFIIVGWLAVTYGIIIGAIIGALCYIAFIAISCSIIMIRETYF